MIRLSWQLHILKLIYNTDIQSPVMSKQFVYQLAFISVFILINSSAHAKISDLQKAPEVVGEYAIIIEGYDWGPAVSRLVLAMEENVTEANYQDYHVLAKRQTDCTDLPAAQSIVNRRIIHAYVSDTEENIKEEGQHITQVMYVSPNNPLDSPIQYTRNDQCSGNNWLNYEMNIINRKTLQTWHTEVDRIMPMIDRFDLSGKFTHDSQTLTYASYVPVRGEGQRPLIIWLHGGGEGGTDPSIPLVTNKAATMLPTRYRQYSVVLMCYLLKCLAIGWIVERAA
jgi:hypothetical protein